jgi:putative ABC transport system permease protein
MFALYFATALRALRRRPVYTAVNLAGLTVGLACCFAVVLFARHEQSYDRFHERAGDLYRVLSVFEGEDGGRVVATPSALADELTNGYASVEQVVRVRLNDNMAPSLLVDGRMQPLKGFAFADSTFLTTFSFPLVSGDARTALSRNQSLVLTQSAARGLFGEGVDPLGKVLTTSWGGVELTVTGVLADPPAQSSLRFDYVVPLDLLLSSQGTSFSDYSYLTFVRLAPQSDVRALESEIDAAMRARTERETGLALQRLTDIRFETGLLFELLPTRDARYVALLLSVGVLLLVVACVNFVTLATAQAQRRAREIGVRKALGAGRGQLVAQMLGESVVLAACAVVLAFGLLAAGLPLFNRLLGGGLALSADVWPEVLGLVGVGLAAGVAAGLYPALYLSRFDASRVLRGARLGGGGAGWLRRGLVTVQFAAAIGLLAGTLTVLDQLRLMQRADVGFDQEQVMLLRPSGPVWQSLDAFSAELTRHPSIQRVAHGTVPHEPTWKGSMEWTTESGPQSRDAWRITTGPGYLETMGLNLVAGRAIESDADEGQAFVLNETAVRAFGLSDPVGMTFGPSSRGGTIVGVVEDFHFASLHQPIEPLVLSLDGGNSSHLFVRAAPGQARAAADHLRATWNAFDPAAHFDFAFVDAEVQRAYASERELSARFGFFAGVALLLTLMGLFALAAYATEQRRREIGVRKALGASVGSVLALLNREFALLVGAGLLVATPVTWWLANRWLSGFAYRVDVSGWSIALAAVVTLGLALLAASLHTIRAARTNPARVLRAE